MSQKLKTDLNTSNNFGKLNSKKIQIAKKITPILSIKVIVIDEYKHQLIISNSEHTLSSLKYPIISHIIIFSFQLAIVRFGVHRRLNVWRHKNIPHIVSVTLDLKIALSSKLFRWYNWRYVSNIEFFSGFPLAIRLKEKGSYMSTSSSI
ncbi:unnamed protein product [Blepharisma stoltei]|uniref:Uncharacterized protein n=1 Tax=Blepharisma stoltei TaxID=1481888 RepID=A0AAU9I9P5_9CILI|nr:unnamed protein product [Blepharisma stoltei]